MSESGQGASGRVRRLRSSVAGPALASVFVTAPALAQTAPELADDRTTVDEVLVTQCR